MPDGTRLTRAAIIFGSNNTGKSNVLKALDFFFRLMVSPPKDEELWQEREAFIFNHKYDDMATHMSMTFYLRGKKYVQSLAFVNDVIVDESLDVYNSTRTSNIYRRDYKGFRGLRVFFSEKNIKLSQISKNIVASNTQDSCTVLAAYARSSVEKCVLADIYDYFVKGYVGLFAKTKDMLDNTRKLLLDTTDNRPKAFIERWLKKGDFRNIDHVNIDEAGKFSFAYSVGNELFEKPEKRESDGFLRYLGHESLLYALDKSVCFTMIDRFDKDLHPKLRRLLLRAFLRDGKRNSQVMFTTHAFYALDKDIMRRDSIWFTKKLDDCETKLIRLSDCKIHPTMSAHNAYKNGALSGKNGVIIEPPKIGKFYMSDEELEEFGLTEDDVVTEKE